MTNPSLDNRDKTKQRRHFSLGLTASALASAAPVLRAQSWPDKPVKCLLSQPPGSDPDNVARILPDRLAKGWGQAVVIDNKPGGHLLAAGYSFYFATTAALVTNPLLLKTLP